MRSRCTPARLEQLRAVAEFSREGGYAAARRLLDQAEPPSAIFVSSDVQAFGALRAVQQTGRRIPQDVAVLSIDGTAASAFTYPSLSAVEVPLEEIARRSIDYLTGTQPAEESTAVLPHRLVLRESCGCSTEPQT